MWEVARFNTVCEPLAKGKNNATQVVIATDNQSTQSRLQQGFCGLVGEHWYEELKMLLAS